MKRLARDPGNLVHDLDTFVCQRITSRGHVVQDSPAYQQVNQEESKVWEALAAALDKALGHDESWKLLGRYDELRSHRQQLDEWDTYWLGLHDGLRMGQLLDESTKRPVLVVEDYEDEKEDVAPVTDTTSSVAK